MTQGGKYQADSQNVLAYQCMLKEGKEEILQTQKP